MESKKTSMDDTGDTCNIIDEYGDYMFPAESITDRDIKSLFVNPAISMMAIVTEHKIYFVRGDKVQITEKTNQELKKGVYVFP